MPTVGVGLSGRCFAPHGGVRSLVLRRISASLAPSPEEYGGGQTGVSWAVDALPVQSKADDILLPESGILHPRRGTIPRTIRLGPKLVAELRRHSKVAYHDLPKRARGQSSGVVFTSSWLYTFLLAASVASTLRASRLQGRNLQYVWTGS